MDEYQEAHIAALQEISGSLQGLLRHLRRVEANNIMRNVQLLSALKGLKPLPVKETP